MSIVTGLPAGARATARDFVLARAHPAAPRGASRSKRRTCSALLLAAVVGSGSGHTQTSPQAWQPGWTLAPYAWIAGLQGSISSPPGSQDPGGGFTWPPRLNVTVDDSLEKIGFMFYGEWRGDRWMVAFDSVWANVSQDARLEIGQLPLVSDVEATIDGNIYQLNTGYRLTGQGRSALAVYGGLRYYDVDASIALGGGVLPGPVEVGSAETWLDAVTGVRWTYAFNTRWDAALLADYGMGQSEASWQIFATLGWRFPWGVLRGGYRYLSVDYETSRLAMDLDLRGPTIGASFSF